MQRKEKIKLEYLYAYNGLKVEYPPNPPLGRLDIKDFKLSTDPGRYQANLTRLVEKRFGIKRADIFRRALPPPSKITPGPEFFLEFVLLYLDGQPMQTIINKLGSDKGGYPGLTEFVMNNYVTRYFSRLVVEIARSARQASKLHSLK